VLILRQRRLKAKARRRKIAEGRRLHWCVQRGWWWLVGNKPRSFCDSFGSALCEQRLQRVTRGRQWVDQPYGLNRSVCATRTPPTRAGCYSSGVAVGRTTPGQICITNAVTLLRRGDAPLSRRWRSTSSGRRSSSSGSRRSRRSSISSSSSSSSRSSSTHSRRSRSRSRSSSSSSSSTIE
jgi:hypothetical protein